MSKGSSSSTVNRKDRFNQTTMGNYLSNSKKDKKPSMKKKKSLLEDDGGFSLFGNYRKNDLEQYRNGYPGKKDNRRFNDNWKFYNNEMKSYPDGDLIENIHKNWWGDYRKLEQHHGYVQWLFPIRESGMNFHAQELQLHEVEKIMNSPEAFPRVLKSYELMLDFYGMKLEKKDGSIHRADNWKERFAHLNRSYHNYLRITRILKFLGEFGFEHFKKPFVEFVLQEGLEEGTLSNTLESCVRYWLETIKCEDDRNFLKDYVRKIEEGYGTAFPPTDPELDHDMSDDEHIDEMISKSHRNQMEIENTNSANVDIDEDSNEANLQDMLKEEEEFMKKSTEKMETETNTNNSQTTDSCGVVDGAGAEVQAKPSEEGMQANQTQTGKEDSQDDKTQSYTLEQI